MITKIVQLSSITIVIQSLSRVWLCDPMDFGAPGSSVLHCLLEFAQIQVHWVGDTIHLILCCSLLLLPSILPRIRIFSNELTLHIKWPKYWSFSFSISPSIEYLELIFFRIDWFDLGAVQGPLESSSTPQFKSINSSALSLPYGPALTSIHNYWMHHGLNYTNFGGKVMSAFLYTV